MTSQMLLNPQKNAHIYSIFFRIDWKTLWDEKKIIDETFKMKKKHLIEYNNKKKSINALYENHVSQYNSN